MFEGDICHHGLLTSFNFLDRLLFTSILKNATCILSLMKKGSRVQKLFSFVICVWFNEKSVDQEKKDSEIRLWKKENNLNK